jgi:hypothetical protein
VIRGDKEDAKSTLNETILEIYGLVGPVAIVRTGPGFFDRRQAPLSDAMIEEGLRTVRLIPNKVRAKKGTVVSGWTGTSTMALCRYSSSASPKTLRRAVLVVTARLQTNTRTVATPRRVV